MAKTIRVVTKKNNVVLKLDDGQELGLTIEQAIALNENIGQAIDYLKSLQN